MRRPRPAAAIALRASACARSNRPGAAMLYERSMAMISSVGPPARRGQVGPRERGGEQQQRRHPRREQQQIAQPPAPRLLDRRAAQQPHRGERHLRRHVAPQQVQHDRDGRGQRADQERGIEEGHGASLLPPLPRGEIRQQREVERLRRVELHVVDAGAAQLALVAQRQPGQLAQIRRPDRRRLRQSPRRRSRVREPRRAAGTETSARSDRAPGRRSTSRAAELAGAAGP